MEGAATAVAAQVDDMFGLPLKESAVREGNASGDTGGLALFFPDSSHPYGAFTQAYGMLSFWHAGQYRICGYLTELANPTNVVDRATGDHGDRHHRGRSSADGRLRSLDRPGNSIGKQYSFLM